MLTLTRKTDYALISLTHLAQDPENCSSAREMAERYQMPLPLLMNVLKLLTQQSLVRSVRGPRGGYTLAKTPPEITLNDIVGAVEGPVHLVRCAAQDENGRSISDGKRCERTSLCPVRSSIHKVHHRLVAFFDDVTLADILNGSDQRETPSTKVAGT